MFTPEISVFPPMISVLRPSPRMDRPDNRFRAVDLRDGITPFVVISRLHGFRERPPVRPAEFAVRHLWVG